MKVVAHLSLSLSLLMMMMMMIMLGYFCQIFSTRIIILNHHQFITIATEILPGVLTWPAKVIISP